MSNSIRRPASIRQIVGFSWPLTGLSAGLSAGLSTGLLLAGLAWPAGARAQLAQALPVAPAVAPAPVAAGISVAVGAGQIIRLPRPVASIFAADPTVVEVRPASATSLFVFGKGAGATTIIATDSNGNTVAEYAVTVGPSGYAAGRLAVAALAAAPGSAVTATSEAGGMVVSGTVQTPAEADQIINQAKLIAPGTVLNNLEIAGPIQVALKVRIASMSRSTTRQLGIDWGTVAASGFNIGRFVLTGNTGTGAPSISGTSPGSVGLGFPGGTIEGVIDALASDNLAHVMAEPTLTTLSGTQANFLVGGQFPIPISESNGQATIEFKSYGVQLTFTPTVFADGRISLNVTPQVSELSNANSATLTGAGGSNASIVVPALTVQGASSTVILGSGQSMAIAGLLEDTSNQTDNAVPGLGEVPVLGALFRGDSFARSQQELVITVTPFLVNPASNPAGSALPDDGWAAPNDLQRIFLLRDNGAMPASASIPGDAGFLVQ